MWVKMFLSSRQVWYVSIEKNGAETVVLNLKFCRVLDLVFLLKDETFFFKFMRIDFDSLLTGVIRNLFGLSMRLE